MEMTKNEALKKIEELKRYIENLDNHIGFENDPIFLLSIDEYKKYKDKIPEFKCAWWLRSVGTFSRKVAFADNDGWLYFYGNSDDNHCIRPAVKLDKVREYVFFPREDLYAIGGFPFTLIDEKKNIAIATVPINIGRFDSTSNDYTISEIRHYLLDWIDPYLRED